MRRRSFLKTIAASCIAVPALRWMDEGGGDGGLLTLVREEPSPGGIVTRDYVWRHGDGVFNNPDNWHPRGVPSAGDRLFFPSGRCELPSRGDFKEIVVTGGHVHGGGPGLSIETLRVFKGNVGLKMDDCDYATS